MATPTEAAGALLGRSPQAETLQISDLLNTLLALGIFTDLEIPHSMFRFASLLREHRVFRLSGRRSD